MKIVCTFAIIDVESGRGKLERAMAKRLVVPVILTGLITDVHGNFDGTSQEFQMEVECVDAGEPRERNDGDD